ncbi:MAG: hypothetical protein ACI86H_001478 [bacterium]|jgi:hypothetical protein
MQSLRITRDEKIKKSPPIRNQRMSNVGDEVSQVLKNYELDDVLTLAKIQKHWGIIVGEQLATKIRPQKIINHHALIIRTSDAAYSHHLKYQTANILEYIASICKHRKIKTLKFQVGAFEEELPLIKPNQSTIEPKKEIIIPKEIADKSKQCSANIGEKKLNQAFSRFMAKRLAKNQRK